MTNIREFRNIFVDLTQVKYLTVHFKNMYLLFPFSFYKQTLKIRLLQKLNRNE